MQVWVPGEPLVGCLTWAGGAGALGHGAQGDGGWLASCYVMAHLAWLSFVTGLPSPPVWVSYHTRHPVLLYDCTPSTGRSPRPPGEVRGVQEATVSWRGAGWGKAQGALLCQITSSRIEAMQAAAHAGDTRGPPMVAGSNHVAWSRAQAKRIRGLPELIRPKG